MREEEGEDEEKRRGREEQLSGVALLASCRKNIVAGGARGTGSLGSGSRASLARTCQQLVIHLESGLELSDWIADMPVL